ncbi:MAG: phosphonate ABC transporter ATP-binding protein, partial [Bacteroidia bacterium]|nr:phosphonate ABC transporter ATP-binding protein [Bacteroidia bacterium]
MKRFSFLIACFVFQLSVGQVTFVINDLPEDHDFDQSIYISGDFEEWSGGKEDFKLINNGNQYSITLPGEYCKILFKFTLGSWSTVETNTDGSALDNRVYNCTNGDETVSISIRGWTIPGSSKPVKSTARENVQILSHEFEIPQLNRKRKIWVYLPADYSNSNERYPVLYMQDGQNLFDQATSYAGEWNVDESMDRITENTGFKAIVVGIDNGGELRINEYVPWVNQRVPKPEGEAYVQFLVETLKPYIDKNFRTKSDTDNTAIMGSSLGGLISHYASLNYPGVFGKAGVFSPSFWIAEDAFKLGQENSKRDTMRMYFLMGDQEGERAVPDMDRMIDLMKVSGFTQGNIRRRVVKDGRHNEKLWRDSFEDSIL